MATEFGTHNRYEFHLAWEYIYEILSQLNRIKTLSTQRAKPKHIYEKLQPKFTLCNLLWYVTIPFLFELSSLIS